MEKGRNRYRGGPVLVQNNEVHVTNEEEMMFNGKAKYDKHPRTAMGYTRDGKLIILVSRDGCGIAEGATLEQEARMLQRIGCVEALNLMVVEVVVCW
jgi:exopolysaccharide biosynthesis protein